MRMYLKNAWYVAAWDHELGREPKAVTMLDERIVLYRRSDGRPTALEDACPHRKLPLSMGRIKGDDIECGYHGLTFDSTGSCTRAACVERIPTLAKVRSYPVEERYGLIWIWMGQADKANPSSIFQVEHWGDPAWGVNRGDSMSIDCNYLYITDNLLDPSHVAWVHQGSFGNSACEHTELNTAVSDAGVTVSRWMLNSEPAPFYVPYLKFSGNCDRKQHYEVRFPSHAIIKAIFVPAGTGGDNRPLHPDVFLMDSYNFMTPIDENHTRYYWFQMRNFSPDDARVSAEFATSVRDAFEEDRVIMQAVHRGMADKQSPNIDLKIDLGPLRFRQRLTQSIAAERELRLAVEKPKLAVAE